MNRKVRYRSFPGRNEMLSILGFGCMRLPQTSDNSRDIDAPLSTEMLRSAIDRGVNYIDTVWPYHGLGGARNFSGRGPGRWIPGESLPIHKTSQLGGQQS